MAKTDRRRTALDAIKELAADDGALGPEEGRKGRRSRAWERQHKGTAMRLYEDDHAWLQNFATANGITQDAAGRGLMRVARQAVERGLVEVEVVQEVEAYTDVAGKARTRVETELRADWQIPRL